MYAHGGALRCPLSASQFPSRYFESSPRKTALQVVYITPDEWNQSSFDYSGLEKALYNVICLHCEIVTMY